VVSTTGGKVIRYLTGAIGGTFSFTLSEDGDTVWFTDNDTASPTGVAQPSRSVEP
jgi:hypothetical protein